MPAASPGRTVLYVSGTTGIGGVETYLHLTARYHHRERWNPVYCFLQPGPLVDQVRESGARVHVLENRPRLSRPWSYASAVNWLRKRMVESGAHVVHSAMAYGALYGAPAARAARTPHVWFQHGPIGAWMDRLAARLPSRAILHVSDEMRRQQAALGGRPCFRKVRYPLNEEKLDAVAARDPHETAARKRREWGIPDSAVVIGLVARLQPWKGTHLLLDAVGRMKARDGVAVVIVGESPERNADYGRALRERGAELPVRTVFAGATDQPLESILAMDILVNASVIPEPFGITVIEAMSLDKMVVVPAEGGPSETVRDGETGIHFTPRDAESLASALDQAVTGETMRKRVGAAAGRDVRERFGPDVAMSELEEVYESIAGR